jgi:hypothetical protein
MNDAAMRERREKTCRLSPFDKLNFERSPARCVITDRDRADQYHPGVFSLECFDGTFESI